MTINHNYNARFRRKSVNFNPSKKEVAAATKVFFERGGKIRKLPYVSPYQLYSTIEHSIDSSLIGLFCEV